MPDLKLEAAHGFPSLLLAGADEVGRGCLAGPVVAAAVLLPKVIDFKKDPWLNELDDSKKLKAATREKLAPLIYAWAYAAAIGVASVAEIDRLNIFHASHLAIVRAIQKLSPQPDHVLIDGKFLPKVGFTLPATAVIQGDQKSLSIAAASIITKVWRDQHMTELAQQYPEYGLAQHKGYPTTLHSAAIQTYGMTEIHRRSFRRALDAGVN